MIELQHISRRFGPLLALDDVSLSIEPGKILGLLGENGAGKSTLMNILFGLLRPTSGTLRIGGREHRISSPRAAQGLGIGMVHQHFKLVPTLTVLENLSLFLRRSPRTLLPSVTALLERLHWQLPFRTRIDQLAVGQRQRVEIVKALLAIQPRRAKIRASACVLILDEPTAVLTPQEAIELFAAVRTLRDTPLGGGSEMGTAIIFISHKLAEIRRVCDSLAILRRGQLVHMGPAQEFSAEQLAEKMIGAKIELPRLNRVRSAPINRHPSDIPALSLAGIYTPILKNVFLRLHAGEILGVAGIDGNGQSHLAQAILGTILPTAGRVHIGNMDATTKPLRWRIDRIACIAEDRHREALVLPLSITENLMLKDYRSRKFNTLGWLRFGAWRSHARHLIKAFDIRANSPTHIAGSLSGGNQQKVVLARELHSSEKPIVLAINPTRGLDIGATAFVMQKLLDAREKGAAILLIHSDLDELLALSDRVCVLYNGTLTETLWPDTTKEAVGKLMLGLPTSPSGGA